MGVSVGKGWPSSQVRRPRGRWLVIERDATASRLRLGQWICFYTVATLARSRDREALVLADRARRSREAFAQRYVFVADFVPMLPRDGDAAAKGASRIEQHAVVGGPARVALADEGVKVVVQLAAGSTGVSSSTGPVGVLRLRIVSRAVTRSSQSSRRPKRLGGASRRMLGRRSTSAARESQQCEPAPEARKTAPEIHGGKTSEPSRPWVRSKPATGPRGDALDAHLAVTTTRVRGCVVARRLAARPNVALGLTDAPATAWRPPSRAQ